MTRKRGRAPNAVDDALDLRLAVDELRTAIDMRRQATSPRDLADADARATLAQRFIGEVVRRRRSDAVQPQDAAVIERAWRRR